MTKDDKPNNTLMNNPYLQYLIIGIIGFMAASIMESKNYINQDMAVQQYQEKNGANTVTNFDFQMLERLKTLEIRDQNREKRDEGVAITLTKIEASIRQIEEGRASIVNDRITKQETIMMFNELRKDMDKKFELLKNEIFEMKYTRK